MNLALHKKYQYNCKDSLCVKKTKTT